jgi:uncharacterized protein YbcV (DUF1398 family)
LGRDSKLILEPTRGTLDGSLTFPKVVGQLFAAGVEYYHVDFHLGNCLKS